MLLHVSLHRGSLRRPCPPAAVASVFWVAQPAALGTSLPRGSRDAGHTPRNFQSEDLRASGLCVGAGPEPLPAWSRDSAGRGREYFRPVLEAGPWALPAYAWGGAASTSGLCSGRRGAESSSGLCSGRGGALRASGLCTRRRGVVSASGLCAGRGSPRPTRAGAARAPSPPRGLPGGAPPRPLVRLWVSGTCEGAESHGPAAAPRQGKRSC